MLLQRILNENRGWKKLGALLQYVTVQLASHLQVLYAIEFSFRSNGCQRRSICVFGAYIEVNLIGFLGGPYCPRQGIFQTFCKFLSNLVSYALCE